MLKFVILCKFFVLLICFHVFIRACVSMKLLILNHLKWNWRRIECDSFSGCYKNRLVLPDKIRFVLWSVWFFVWFGGFGFFFLIL